MIERYEPATLFLSYAHEDKSLCREFEKHLRPLQQQGLISVWHDRLIEPGATWAQEIDEQLKGASVILLLVSPDFIASDYCYSTEMSQALERHKAGTACVIPIILRSAGWQETSLGTLQALPSGGKPITSWPDRDEAFEQVAKGIHRVILALRPSVFIVSSPPDQPLVARLSSDLKTHGIIPWFYHVESGQDTSTSLKESVRDEMQGMSPVLLIASPNARHSRFVKERLELAAVYRQEVMVLWVRGDSWEESVPEGWSEQHVIDVRKIPYEKALQEVLTCIRSRQAIDPPPVPPSHKPETMNEPRNPYKGLRAFLHEDAHDFFGRDTLIQQMLNEWRTLLDEERVGKPPSRLLAVLGPSGSGKSSVVMAGLLPRLQQDALAGSTRWLFLDCIFPGIAPLEALAISLAKNYPKKDSIAIHQLLESDSSRVLHQLVAEIAPPDGKVLLVIDQFEELFAQAVSEKERLHFFDLLVTATLETHGPLMCILTLRADFFGRVMDYPQIYRCIDAHRCGILPLDLHELREIIEKPAALLDVQLNYEGNLVSDLLIEARGQAGALPLLQFTLDQLYQRRSGHSLTYRAYKEIGGVRGGILKQAEDTYTSLGTDEQRKMVRVVFLRLVNLGVSEHNPDLIRRRAFLSEFALDDPTRTDQMQEVIEAFTKARLLTTSQDGGKMTLEVSHEAVLHEWSRLSDWLSEGRSDLSTQQAINRDALAWEQRGKPRDRLYRGSQLKEAQEWVSRSLPSKQEAVFLSASRVSRAQSLLSIFALCALLLTTTGLVGWFFLTLPPDPTHVTILEDSGVGSLRWAITNAPAKSTITFDSSLKGTIILKNDDLDITKNVRIQGSDTHLVSISGGHQNLKVHIFQRISVTISDLVFRDGMLTRYSMIYNEGTLELINCIVSGNTALADAIDRTQWAGNGGGIYNAGTLTLTSTTVSHNEAKKSGGGIYNTGILTLNKSTLSWNKVTGSGYGGGISTIGTLTLNSSTISENTVPQGGGGGIFNGCVYNTFPNIEARCKDGNQIATLTLKNNSAVSNNVSYYGGGIFNTGKFTMISSHVSGNRTANEGSGIDNMSPFDVRFTNSTISGNSSSGKSFGGGGIYNDGSEYDDSKTSTLELVKCTVSENTASNGGGIFSRFSTLTLIDTTISENTTLPANTHDKDRYHNGGGLVNLFSATILINSTISGNRASQDGGGIFNQGGIIFIAFCTLINNTANKGGALETVDDSTNDPGHILHGRVLIKGNILVSNKADTYPNSYGQITSGGYNLIQDMSTVNISENRLPGTDISVNSQNLATIFSAHAQLQDNGGPSKTHALLTNKSNPAIDKVPLVSCSITISKIDTAITTDQRGEPRPDQKEAMCNIGAYESQD